MKLKRAASLMTIAIILGVSATVWIFAQVAAQAVFQQGRIDAFTYFIPYPAEDLDNEFNLGDVRFNYIGLDIETVISMAVRRGGTVIYYDHWEDGLEADLTNPTQPTTAVWGDGDPSNNGAGTVIGLPGDDMLTDGDVLRLQNRVELEDDGTRNASQIFFDGGDSLTALDGPIGVTLGVWPRCPIGNMCDRDPNTLFAGAWGLLPTNRWGEEYIIPIGEDLGPGLNDPPPYPPNTRRGFIITGLSVMGVENGTVVDIDLDGDGAPDQSVTLDDSNLRRFTAFQGVQVGARVTVTSGGPVQVHVFTTDPDPRVNGPVLPPFHWEARAYTMIPFTLFADDWLGPRSSDGDYWLHNPNGSPLAITVQTSTAGPDPITVPANTTIRYSNTPTMSTATGMRFTSTDGRLFAGVVALDPDSAQDWGYGLQPVEFLASQILVPWGVGNAPDGDINNLPNGNQSRVYVTAPSDTTVNVIYADGTTASFPVPALAEVPITAPNNDMTGAFLFTNDGDENTPNTPFVAVWGQDQSADAALPSIDLGTGLLPLQSLTLQKTYRLFAEADCNGAISAGDTLRFRLRYFNNTAVQVSSVILQDSLPPQLTYVPDSIVVNGSPVSDASGATDLFGSGYQINAPLNPSQSGQLTFEAAINDASGPITNIASVRTDSLALGGDVDTTTVIIPVGGNTDPILEVTQTLVDPAGGTAQAGDMVTYETTIANISNIDIVSLPLQITFDPDDLTFVSASVTETLTIDPGILTWDDLATSGPLLPNSSVSFTTTFEINHPPPPGSIPVDAEVIGALGEGLLPLFCAAQASVNVSEPPTPTPTRPRGGDGDDDDPTSTPPPPPPATPVAAAPPPAELPVAFLPETGLRDAPWFNNGVIGITLLLTLSGASAMILVWRKRKK